MGSKFTLVSSLLLACAVSSQSAYAQGIATFAGNHTGGYTGDGGAAVSASFSNPTGVATYGFSNVYIADQGNHVVRKVNYLHNISTYAGNGIAGNTNDDSLATHASLDRPYNIAVDAADNIYIADHNSHVIRKVSVGGIITTIAGNDTAGYSGDGGMATDARLDHPYGVAVDAVGNVYIADANNNVVRMVNPAGIITTIAGNGTGAGLGVGNGSYSGDGGPAVNAGLNFPESIAIDVLGNIFVADAANNRIRKISTTGIITTVAGNGMGGYSGDGGAAASARLNFAAGVAVDNQRNIYIADQGNNAIRKVDTAGVIRTIAGNGTNGYSGDGGLASLALLNAPSGVAVDGNGLVYIADYGNHVIRVIGANAAAVNNVRNTANGLAIYPNPVHGTATIVLPKNSDNATVTVTDMLGRVVTTATVAQGAQQYILNTATMPAGNYVVRVDAAGNTYREKITVTE